jgi:photosystem II stability/assembly factor-like uncharacterized protein
MRKPFSLLCLFLLSIFCCLPAGYVSSAAVTEPGQPINENSLVFRSLDGGVSWSSFAEIGRDFLAHSVSHIVVDPVDSSTVYLGTNNGIFKTTDAGRSWQDCNSGLGSLHLRDLKVDPLNPANLYALVGQIFDTGAGLFRSRDGGRSWARRPLTFNPPPAFSGGNSILFPTALTIDPVNPGTLYVGARGAEFVVTYKSTDGGDTFRHFQRGFSLSLVIQQIDVDRQSPSTVYESYNIGNRGILIKKSLDGGETFSPTRGIFDDEEVRLEKFLVDPQNPSNLYLSTISYLLKSADGGVFWDPFRRDPGPSTLLTIGQDSTLYGMAGNNLLKSVDGGITYMSTNLFRRFRSLGLDPQFPSVIYAGDEAPAPEIINVTPEGKHLVITGKRVHEGAVVLIDSVPHVTKIDFQQSPVSLLAKKAFKRISPGQRVQVTIREADGTLSGGISYTKPF